MAARKGNQLFSTGLKEWAYYRSGFHKLGLMRDDVRRENTDVQEALRRLPQHLVDERNFRIIRAMQLNSSHSVLPESEWTKYENDVFYLKPYLEEVIKERQEKETWNNE